MSSLGDHYDDAYGSMIFTEWDPQERGNSFRIKHPVEHVVTPFQTIDLYETESDGKLLVHDGAVMLTERDEFVYHEMLVHVPMLSHPDPRRILVVGGGDGGTLREIIRHNCVEIARQVEIDEEVVNIAKKHLPGLAKAYDHPKVDLVIDDGIKLVKDATKGSYDVIMVDSTDPVGPAEPLFQEPFYTGIYNALADDGILSLQAANTAYHLDLLVEVVKRLKQVFPVVLPYTIQIPAYPSGGWCMIFASKGREPFITLDDDRVKSILPDCKYWNPEIHKAAFALPQYVINALQ